MHSHKQTWKHACIHTYLHTYIHLNIYKVFMARDELGASRYEAEGARQECKTTLAKLRLHAWCVWSLRSDGRILERLLDLSASTCRCTIRTCRCLSRVCVYIYGYMNASFHTYSCTRKGKLQISHPDAKPVCRTCSLQQQSWSYQRLGPQPCRLVLLLLSHRELAQDAVDLSL